MQVTLPYTVADVHPYTVADVHPEPLRVAIDATACLDRPTGVGVFTQHLLAGLKDDSRLDLRAYAVTWRGRGRLGSVIPPSIDHVDRPMPARPLRACWSRFGSPPIEWWTGPIDVVHGTNYVVPPARHAAQVVSVYDLTPVRFPELCNTHTLAYPALIARACANGAWVHTMSRVIADEIIEHFKVPAERVVVVPGGVIRSPPVGPSSSADIGRLVAGSDRYVLALGTIEPRKNLPALVAAFDQLADEDTDLRLVLAGPDGWGAVELDETIAAAHHGARIVRTGWVDDDTRAGLLRGATVFAYPSRYEGFGFPPLEAMSEGIPVVTTDAGSLVEVVGNAAEIVPAGLLETDHQGRHDPTGALAEALHLVLTDDVRRAELTRRGLERVTAFSWERTAAGMAELYLRAASR